MPATRWEYKKVDLAAAPLKADGDIALLNERGRQGWELVGITANSQAYLRRRTDKVVRASAPEDGLREAKRSLLASCLSRLACPLLPIAARIHA
jgi:hypothetical protein